ncbi:MAG: thioredoxin domain-containing protein [Bauldia sp.]|nr:thioredoxin domain-containing protein [Bauldia sp.]
MRIRPAAIGMAVATALAAIAALLGGQAAAQGEEPVVVAQAESAFTDAQLAEIEALIAAWIAANPGFIRDYLVSNPEVIREAVTELERRRIEAEAVLQAETIAQLEQELLYSPRQSVVGNPDGEITLVEFFDYNCTYCRHALEDMSRLMVDYPDLRIVLKEFPVLGPGSVEAAQVAAALNIVAPEKYWDFHQLLLGSGVAASAQAALDAAARVGVDRGRLEAMLEDAAVIAAIEESYTVADALGLNGTPTYILGTEVIVGAVGYDQLRVRIDSMRECGETSCL